MTDAQSLEKCAICLEDFKDKSGINGCAHSFCFECIELWSKNTNTCPLCKKEFHTIRGVGESSAKKIKRVKRKRIVPVYDADELARLTIDDDQHLIDLFDNDNDDDEDDEDSFEREDESADNGIRGYNSRDGFIVNDSTIEYEDDDGDDDEEEDDDGDDEEESEDDDVEVEEDDDDSDTDDDDDDDVEIVRFLINGVEMPESSIYKKRKTNNSSSLATRKSERISFLKS